MQLSGVFGTDNVTKAILSDTPGGGRPATNHGYWMDSTSSKLRQWGTWPAP